MFTADGQLRDEYQHLEDQAEVNENEEAAEPIDTSPSQEPEEPAAPPVAEAPPLREAAGYPTDGERQPQFMDLVGMLAEPASLYLREAQMARGGELRAVSKASQNLEMARLHIDLLKVLREKSAVNVDRQELAMLDDVIYRLQMAFVQAQE